MQMTPTCTCSKMDLSVTLRIISWMRTQSTNGLHSRVMRHETVCFQSHHTALDRKKWGCSLPAILTAAPLLTKTSTAPEDEIDERGENESVISAVCSNNHRQEAAIASCQHLPKPQAPIPTVQTLQQPAILEIALAVQ